MSELIEQAVITISHNPMKFAVADIEDGAIVNPITPINIEDYLSGRVVLIYNSGPATISVRPVGGSADTLQSYGPYLGWLPISNHDRCC